MGPRGNDRHSRLKLSPTATIGHMLSNGLLYKEEDLSSGLRAHIERPGTVACAHNPWAEEAELGDSWSLSVASQNLASSSREAGFDHGVRRWQKQEARRSHL